MNVFAELAIILAICVVGEVVSAMLPFVFPSSIVSLCLLIVLLLTGVIKEGHIKKTADFITSHMSLFFVPSCIGIMQYSDLILPQIVPFTIIAVITTPLVYATTGWTVQLMMRHMNKKEVPHDD